MERDPDIRMLALRMNSRQFPYIDFANPPVRTNHAAELPAAQPDPSDELEPEAPTVPEAPAVVLLKASIPAAPEPTPLHTPEPAALPSWAPPAEPAVAIPRAWAHQLASAPPPVAVPAPRQPAPPQTQAADFPLIRTAMQEARDLATPPPSQAPGGATADWLRARPAAAQA